MSTQDSTSNAIEKNRIVFLSGLFNEEKAKDVITNILTLEAKDPTKDILLIIDSYGGYIHSLLAIHDVMKSLCRCDIITLGIGKQMSCGQLLLMSGTKSKRFATPNSRILMHQISAGTFGKLSDMEIDINENKAIQKTLDDLIIRYTKITRKQLPILMSKDSFFSAEESIKWGIIDGIIAKPTDLYKNPKVNL